MRALRRFPYLPDALGRIPTRRLCRLYLEAPSGHGITLSSHEPAALMVRRIEFDALLSRQHCQNNLLADAGFLKINHALRG